MTSIHPLTSIICLPLLGVAVFVLNITAFFVSFNMRRGSMTDSYPLLWLLFANTLIGGITLPAYGLKKYDLPTRSSRALVCDVWRSMYFTTTHLALVSLLLMTFDQILIIKFPLRYPLLVTKIKKNVILLTVWLIVISFDAIPFFPLGKTDSEFCHYKVTDTWSMLMNILTIAIPLPVLLLSYSAMLYLSYGQYSRLQHATCRRNITRKRSVADSLRIVAGIKASRKLTYVVGSYIVCWTPQCVYYILIRICRKSCFSESFHKQSHWVKFFFKILAMFHAFVTPMLFCWKRKAFRKDTKRWLRKISGTSISSTAFNDSDLREKRKRTVGVAKKLPAKQNIS